MSTFPTSLPRPSDGPGLTIPRGEKVVKMGFSHNGAWRYLITQHQSTTGYRLYLEDQQTQKIVDEEAIDILDQWIIKQLIIQMIADQDPTLIPGY